jgi:hypothetical protein
MITGDSKTVADSVAKRIGIDEVAAEVLPADKASAVKRFQAGGKRVAMVGDGVNDAPALATANVGIAIGAGTDVAIESAGIVLVRSDPRDVVGAIELSRATYRKMIQNLVWATAYNLVAIPVAAGAFVHWGLDLPMSVGAVAISRDESLYHHRRRKRPVASSTEAAKSGRLNHRKKRAFPLQRSCSLGYYFSARTSTASTCGSLVQAFRLCLRMTASENPASRNSRRKVTPSFAPAIHANQFVSLVRPSGGNGLERISSAADTVPSAAVARPSLESLPAFSHNKRYQAQGRHRISPGDAPDGIRNQTCERDDRQVAAECGLCCICSQSRTGSQGRQTALLLREDGHHNRCHDQYNDPEKTWPYFTKSKQRLPSHERDVRRQREQKASRDSGC